MTQMVYSTTLMHSGRCKIYILIDLTIATAHDIVTLYQGIRLMTQGRYSTM